MKSNQIWTRELQLGNNGIIREVPVSVSRFRRNHKFAKDYGPTMFLGHAEHDSKVFVYSASDKVTEFPALWTFVLELIHHAINFLDMAGYAAPRGSDGNVFHIDVWKSMTSGENFGSSKVKPLSYHTLEKLITALSLNTDEHFNKVLGPGWEQGVPDGMDLQEVYPSSLRFYSEHFYKQSVVERTIKRVQPHAPWEQLTPDAYSPPLQQPMDPAHSRAGPQYVIMQPENHDKVKENVGHVLGGFSFGTIPLEVTVTVFVGANITPIDYSTVTSRENHSPFTAGMAMGRTCHFPNSTWTPTCMVDNMMLDSYR